MRLFSTVRLAVRFGVRSGSSWAVGPAARLTPAPAMALTMAFAVTLALAAVWYSPVASAGKIELLNAGFEEGVTDSGAPVGWTEGFGRAAFGDSAALSEARAFEGRWSLRIEDRWPDASIGVRSVRIPAEPGRYYTASVKVYNEQGGSSLYLEFWNDQGTRVSYVATSDTRTGEWRTLTASSFAPEGATSLTLLLYGNIPNTGVVYFDAAMLESDEETAEGEVGEGVVRVGSIPGVPAITFDLAQADFPIPPLSELRARIPASHPRLFVRPETLSDLQNKRTRSLFARMIWNNIHVRATTAQYDPLPQEPPHARPGGVLDVTAWRRGIDIANDILNRLHALGFAYLVTGEERFGQAGKELLVHVSKWDPYGTSGRAINDEVSMRLLYGLSRAYDWLYPLLSPEERSIVQESLRHRGNDVYITMRRTRFEDDLLNNHLTRSMGFLGEAAIALMGEVPEAEVWFDYIVSLFALRYPAFGAEEGGWSQGVSYWQSYISWVFDFLDALKIATDLDLYQKPFFKNTPYFKLYAHPPKSKWGAFGDHTDSPPDEGSARVMGHFALVYNEPLFQWYASQISGTGRVPVLPLDNFLGYLRAPESTDALVDPALPADLPQSRLFSDVGWALMNVDMANWANNVHVKFKSSPYGSFNHSHAEQNSFIIEAYGSPLAISSGYYPYYGSPHHSTWTWESRSKNTILVNGRGQVVQSIDAKGEIVDWSFGSQFDYVVGSAAQAYAGRVDRFLRHLWFIKPNLIVTYDQIESPGPATYDWLLHSLKRMEVDEANNRVRVPADTAEMWVSFAVPNELEFSLTDQFTVRPEDRDAHKPDQWHFSAKSVASDGVGRFLAVMVPRPRAAFETPAPVVEPLAVENGHGTSVQAGGRRWTIAFRDGEGLVKVGGLVVDADAVATWTEGDRSGFMAVNAVSIVDGGTVLLDANRPVSIGVEWGCALAASTVKVQLEDGRAKAGSVGVGGAAAGGVEVGIASPCVPANFELNGELVREFTYGEGMLKIRL